MNIRISTSRLHVHTTEAKDEDTLYQSQNIIIYITSIFNILRENKSAFSNNDYNTAINWVFQYATELLSHRCSNITGSCFHFVINQISHYAIKHFITIYNFSYILTCWQLKYYFVLFIFSYYSMDALYYVHSFLILLIILSIWFGNVGFCV